MFPSEFCRLSCEGIFVTLDIHVPRRFGICPFRPSAARANRAPNTKRYVSRLQQRLEPATGFGV